jgi:type IV secretion system protein VirB10
MTEGSEGYPRVDPATGEVVRAPEPVVAGARGIASVARERAKRSTLQGAALVGGLAVLGLGGLYFVLPHANSERQAAVEAAKRERAAKLNAEMPVRRIHVEPLAPPAPIAAPESHSVADAVLGGRPDDPMAAQYAAAAQGQAAPGIPGSGGAPHPSRQERMLAAPVMYRTSASVAGATALASSSAMPAVDRFGGDSSSQGADRGSALGAALRPTLTPAVRAERMPDRRWLLPKGSFADCTLETAIDSTLPGMTTCVLALDVFSADGTVVLLERGTRLVGEARSDVRPGQRRVAILWTEARTPTGVIARLDSLGTDELGRSGVPGNVDNHFLERFGAAILISLIDSGTQALANSSSSGNGALVINPSRSTDVMTEVLRSTIAIPPTITVPQGARLQVLVARDVDFRSVYALKDRN